MKYNVLSCIIDKQVEISKEFIEQELWYIVRDILYKLRLLLIDKIMVVIELECIEDYLKNKILSFYDLLDIISRHNINKCNKYIISFIWYLKDKAIEMELYECASNVHRLYNLIQDKLICRAE